LALALSLGASPEVQAKALASVALNVTSLIWYRYDGSGPISPGVQDPALYGFGSTDNPKVGSLSIVGAQSRDQAGIVPLNSLQVPDPDPTTGERSFGQVSQPLNLPHQCSGPGCNLDNDLPYSDNDFLTPPPSVDALTTNYSYIDQNLAGEAFGFGVNRPGQPVVLPGASIGGRAEVSLPYKSTGDALPDVGGASVLESTLRVSAPGAPFSTYFVAQYTLFAVASLDALELPNASSYAEASWNFDITTTGYSAFGQKLVGRLTAQEGESPDPIAPMSGTVYSVENPFTSPSGFLNFVNINARTLTLKLGVSAVAVSTEPPQPAPAPGTAALLALGGLIVCLVRRRAHGSAES